MSHHAKHSWVQLALASLFLMGALACKPTSVSNTSDALNNSNNMAAKLNSFRQGCVQQNGTVSDSDPQNPSCSCFNSVFYFSAYSEYSNGASQVVDACIRASAGLASTQDNAYGNGDSLKDWRAACKQAGGSEQNDYCVCGRYGLYYTEFTNAANAIASCQNSLRQTAEVGTWQDQCKAAGGQAISQAGKCNCNRRNIDRNDFFIDAAKAQQTCRSYFGNSNVNTLAQASSANPGTGAQQVSTTATSSRPAGGYCANRGDGTCGIWNHAGNGTGTWYPGSAPLINGSCAGACASLAAGNSYPTW